MQDFKFFNSIDEVFLTVHTMESNINLILSVDASSKAGLKLLKKLILICNSVSISLLQQEYLEDTLALLKIADKADIELSRYGHKGDLWQGRLLTPGILAYLYFKQQRYMDSLKFLYKTLSLVQEIKENGQNVHVLLKNLINVLTFMTLYRMNKYKECERYIESVADNDLSTVRGRGLFAIVTVSRAAIAVKKSKEYLHAIEICENSLKRIEREEVSSDLLREMIVSLYNAISNKGIEEELINSGFITVFYLSCFIPLIAPGTPVLKLVSKAREFEVKIKRPAFSANRVRPSLKKLKIGGIDDLKSDHAPASTRRSIRHSSREKLLNYSLPQNNLQVMLTKTYLNGSKLSYFSPRIAQAQRPKSSKVNGQSKGAKAK